MDTRSLSATGGREAQILDHAMAVFMRYGYARSTMDDIAREAGMSRPALYQFFRNKADIYRAIARGFLDASLDTIRRELDGNSPLAARLASAIDKGLLEGMEDLEQSSHGSEMLDLKNEMCADIVDGFRAGMISLFEDAYASKPVAAAGGASVLALQLADYLEGLKARVRGRRERIVSLETFLELQLAGLEAMARSAGSPR